MFVASTDSTTALAFAVNVVIVAPVVGLSATTLRLATPFTVLNRPTTYSRVPSGEASISLTLPSNVGRKPVSTSPVSMLYAASLGWFTVVVLPGALFWIELKFPTMNTRLPMASMSVTRPDMIRGRFARAVDGTSVVWPGPGVGVDEDTVIDAEGGLFALALLAASTASTVYV